MVGEAHVHHTHGAPFFRTYSCCDQGCNPSRSSSCLNILICHSSHSAALPQNAIRHCRLEQRQTFYLCLQHEHRLILPGDPSPPRSAAAAS